MTRLQKDLLLQFSGPEKGFQAPGGGAKFEQHEEWRNTVYAALKGLEEEEILVIKSMKKCGTHGKCFGLPIAAKCRLTEEGERVWSELRAVRS